MIVSQRDLFDQLSEYLDGCLTEEEKAEIEAFLDEDESAREELQIMRSIAATIREIPQLPLPQDFNSSLHGRLLALPKIGPPQKDFPSSAANLSEGNKKKKFYRSNLFKGIAACAAVFVFVVAASAIGSFDMAGMQPAQYDTFAPQESTGGGSDIMMRSSFDGEESANIIVAPDLAVDKSMVGMEESQTQMATYSADLASASAFAGEAKLIKNASIGLEVRDVEEAGQAINQIVQKYGGYVLASDSYSDEAGHIIGGSIALRVGNASLEQSLAEITAVGTLLNKSLYAEDVSTEYIDLQARIQQYQEQKNRLKRLYEATNEISDLVQIESELMRVQSELDSLTGQMKYLKEVTDMATINISLTLPALYEQKVMIGGWDNIGSRLYASLMAGISTLIAVCANIIIFIFYILPVIAILLIIFLIWRAVHRKNQDQ